MMTASISRLTILGLLILLLSACGDDGGPSTEATLRASASEGSAVLLMAGARDNALTPQELAVDPGPAAPPDPEPEQAEVDRPVVLEAASEAAESGDRSRQSDTPTELEWEALIPEEWQPDRIMERYNAEQLEDDDPRARELMYELQALWRKAPVVPDLDGKRVKLPGFIVPLDTDGQKTGEFLLVPYYGACIHVPPPPANQTVYVRTEKGREYPGELFDTVWVTGTLGVESFSGDFAEAGYRLQASEVIPYE